MNENSGLDNSKIKYSGWTGVRKLSKKLGYSWFDVCNILWKTKHHKQPSYAEILLFSVIRKNLIKIKLGKHLRDVQGNLVRRTDGEQDIHYAIRADLDLFKQHHTIKKLWKDEPDFYKSIRQKYSYLYKRFAKEINNHAAMMS
jgi:hypothetical protein